MSSTCFVVDNLHLGLDFQEVQIYSKQTCRETLTLAKDDVRLCRSRQQLRIREAFNLLEYAIHVGLVGEHDEEVLCADTISNEVAQGEHGAYLHAETELALPS